MGGEFWFCNPPYGRVIEGWFAKCAANPHGIMLTFARTETGAFHDHVWWNAHALLFFKSRLTFVERNCATCGRGQSVHFGKKPPQPDHNYIPGPGFVPGEQSSGAPSVLIAYGEIATARIRSALLNGKIPGKLVMV